MSLPLSVRTVRALEGTAGAAPSRTHTPRSDPPARLSTEPESFDRNAVLMPDEQDVGVLVEHLITGVSLVAAPPHDHRQGDVLAALRARPASARPAVAVTLTGVSAALHRFLPFRLASFWHDTPRSGPIRLRRTVPPHPHPPHSR